MVIIHGGIGREDRTKIQEAFRHDPEVKIMLASDAAGEGSTSSAPTSWSTTTCLGTPTVLSNGLAGFPVSAKRRVCHLWILVAEETREGDVYRRLLDKLEQARQALGGQVFDVLGKLQFEGKPLRDLLIEAFVTATARKCGPVFLLQWIMHLSRGIIQDLLEEHALARDVMDASMIQRVREDMERAEARRLQPII